VLFIKIRDHEGDSRFELDRSWDVHPYNDSFGKFQSKANEKMSKFIASEKEKNSLSYECDSDAFAAASSEAAATAADTWIFPTVQMGLFNVHQDCEVTTKLLEAGQKGSTFKFGTGYFNPTAEYLDVILNRSAASYDLLEPYR
jgi:hypothetical protein